MCCPFLDSTSTKRRRNKRSHTFDRFKNPVEHVWINPDCGLKTRGERETVASLQHMVQATKEIRAELRKS